MKIAVQRVNDDPREILWDWYITDDAGRALVLSQDAYLTEKSAEKAARRFIKNVRKSA